MQQVNWLLQQGALSVLLRSVDGAGKKCAFVHFFRHGNSEMWCVGAYVSVFFFLPPGNPGAGSLLHKFCSEARLSMCQCTVYRCILRHAAATRQLRSRRGRNM